MEERMVKLKVQLRNGCKLNAQTELDNASTFSKAEKITSVPSAEKTLAKLQSYRTRLQELNEEILLNIAEAEMDSESAKVIEFDEQLLDSIETLSLKIRDVSQKPIARSGDNEVLHVSNVSDKFHASVKLPKLEIAKFSGDALNFQQFWDSYDNAIHSNADLSPIDKFNYLITLLEGDAQRVVNGYRLTSVNYDVVIKILKERYGNPQVAIFSHFEAMLSLPSATLEYSNLQSIFDECEKHIRSLVALGLPEETFGQVFIPIVLSKLPYLVRMELHRRNGSKVWTLSHLRELLKEEIHAREMCERNFASAKNYSQSGGSGSSKLEQESAKQSNRFKKQYKVESTTSSLVSPSQSRKLKCAYCDEDHFSDQCSKFPDVESRRRELKDRCLSCLKPGHRTRECPQRQPCWHCKTEGHHRSLCNKKYSSVTTSTIPNASLSVTDYQDRGESLASTEENTSMLSHGQRTMLQTGLAFVSGPKQSSRARLLFDTACSRSFIKTSVCQQIGARHIGKEEIAIAGFADNKHKSNTYAVYEVDVLCPDGSRMTLTANGIDRITCPVQKLPINVKKHPFVTMIPLAEPLIDQPQAVEVDILIGADYYYDFIGAEQIKCSDGLIFLSSVLGYIATGRIQTLCHTPSHATTMLLHKSSSIPESNFELERFWKLEDIGIKDTKDSTEDEVALRYFNDTIRFNNGRYEVKWPWKEGCGDLADNYQLAQGRLRSLLKRLNADENLKTQYDKIMKEQLQKGIIEEVPVIPDGDQLYYMPHHCVVTPQKTTTKVRIVYDASSKAGKNERSLNECLLRGPVLLSDLGGLLMRFRLHPVAITSDIEKAFLQVRLQKPDRDVTRFLWLRDISAPCIPANIVEYRFCRVPFGVNSSPFMLGGTVNHHLNQSECPYATEISENAYVDNVLSGKSSSKEALVYYNKAKKVFTDASMNLREWYSNDKEFMQTIPEADRGSGTTTSVLGIKWDIKSDMLNCSVGNCVSDVTTKRQMLKSIASVYDPCGFFAPVVIRGKILIQELWKDKYDWDTVLPESIQTNCHQIRDDIAMIPNFQLRRRLFDISPDNSNDYQLHCFCDASAKAYSAVVYLRCTTHDQISSSLIFCKSRVSPVKTLSIPRLELMATTIGARILVYVQSQLGLSISQRYIWSDSQCTLHWILGREVTSIFVRNRVNEIKSHGNICFRYVPTNTNPADLPSRGLNFENLSESGIWSHGPSWLIADTTTWPVNITLSAKPVEPVIPTSDDINDVSLVNTETSNSEAPIDISRFSSLPNLLRVTSLVFRFVNKLRKNETASGAVSSLELAVAFSFWVKCVQKSSFGELASKNKPKSIRELGLFYDNEGIIRCKGRLDNTEVSTDTNNPILLPKGHSLTRLIIIRCHIKLCHAWVTHTLSQLRHKYWIPSGRSEVTQVLRTCVTCKHVDGGSFQIPTQPPLPDFRSVPKRPFACVGIDYLGPLYIRTDSENSKKVWICLFTCAVIRAIHLEVVDDMSTASFLLCLRRFMAHYGKPDLIISDNAKHFRLSKNVLDRLWQAICESEDTQNFVAGEGVRWKFITEHAPWMGGFYERMIALVKKSLKKTILFNKLSLSELQTIAIEISAVLNTRPIVYVDNEVKGDALTPSHFLLRQGSQFPPVEIQVDEYRPQPTSSDSLVSEWKRIQAVLNSFWKSWKNDYLLNLRESWRNQKQRNVSTVTPNVGVVVLIEDNLPRSCWKMGVIVNLVSSADDQVRTARVRLATGKVINRPIRLLYPIEFSAFWDNTSTKTLAMDPLNAKQNPTRRAAEEAGKKIRHQLSIE